MALNFSKPLGSGSASDYQQLQPFPQAVAHETRICSSGTHDHPEAHGSTDLTAVVGFASARTIDLAWPGVFRAREHSTTTTEHRRLSGHAVYDAECVRPAG